MTGWAAAVEVLQRHKHLAGNLYETVLDARIAGKAPQVLLGGPMGVPRICARISLAATFRKLVWPYLHLAKRECPSQKASRIRKQPEFDDIEEDILTLPELDKSLLVLTNWCYNINAMSIILGANSNNNISSEDVPCDTTDYCVLCTLPRHEGSGQDIHFRHNLFIPVLIHQLQAISLNILVQACMWRMDCEGTSIAAPLCAPGEWLLPILDMCERLDISALSALMISMLQESELSAPRTQVEIDVVWERYAVLHFHGRLVPGCCNMGCVNMSGLTEAALKTLLCSGCRRARYCSVECQRAAWQCHRSVCQL